MNLMRAFPFLTAWYIHIIMRVVIESEVDFYYTCTNLMPNLPGTCIFVLFFYVVVIISIFQFFVNLLIVLVLVPNSSLTTVASTGTGGRRLLNFFLENQKYIA